MRKFVLSLWFVILGLFVFGQTNIGGVLSSDTTLLLINSPYIVTNNLLVQQGVTVIVEPGVEFRFNEGIFLQIDGEFRAIGTNTDSIIFTKNSGATNGWGGIRFTDNANDYVSESGNGCILSFCRIEYSGYESNPTAHIIYSIKTDILLEHCNIRYFHDGISLFRTISIVRNCKIHDGEYASLYMSGIGIDSMAYAFENEIFNNYGGNNQDISLDYILFGNNHIHNIGTTEAIRLILPNIFVGNLVENNNVGLLVLPDVQFGINHVIVCNSFINNDINMKVICEIHPYLANNNFISPGTYNIVWDTQPITNCILNPGSGDYATIDFSNNYWGGLSNSQIDASIWDFNDDFSLQAVIDYQPTLIDSIDTITADCSYPLINSISEGSKQIHINVYPNPTLSTLTIENASGLYYLTDITGKTLLSGTISAAAFTLDISALSSGVYFLTLSEGGQQVVRKVVKQ